MPTPIYYRAPLSFLMNPSAPAFNFLNDGINPTVDNRYKFSGMPIADMQVENYTANAHPPKAQYARRINTHAHYDWGGACRGVNHRYFCTSGCHVGTGISQEDIHNHFLMFAGFRWNWRETWKLAGETYQMGTHAIEIMFRCSGTNQGNDQFLRVGLMNAISVDNDPHPNNLGHDRYVASVLLKSTVNGRYIEEATILNQLCRVISPNPTAADKPRIKSTPYEYFTLRIVIDPTLELFTAYLRDYSSAPVQPGGLNWDAGNPSELLFSAQPVCTDIEELAPAFSSNAYGGGTNEPIAICGFRWLPA